MTHAFYRNGVRFECTQCGACCTGAPGRVRVNPREAESLARLLGLEVAAFRAAYARQDGTQWLLREKENGDCVFFRDGRCSVYEARPLQCRLYPFWFRNLRSEEAWADAARTCPGIGRGRLYTAAEIEDLVGQDLEDRAGNV